jgi:hypothetical protein
MTVKSAGINPQAKKIVKIFRTTSTHYQPQKSPANEMHLSLLRMRKNFERLNFRYLSALKRKNKQRLNQDGY